MNLSTEIDSPLNETKYITCYMRYALLTIHGHDEIPQMYVGDFFLG